MPKYSNEIVSRTSLALLKPLLAALDPAGTAILKPTSSLPAPCFWVPAVRVVVCATSINTLPIYRAAMISVAAIDKVDAIVVQHGLFPEELDEVMIDVVTPSTCSGRWPAIAGPDGGTWLVPPAGGAGPSVRLDANGVTTSIEAPYADLDERGDGLSRAARETVRTMRVLRRS